MGTALSGAGIPKEPAQFFLREAGSISFNRSGDKTVLNTMLGHLYEASIKIPSLQQTWQEYLNAMLLSTTLVQGVFTMNAVAGDPFSLNFIDNAGGQDPVGGTNPATGSALMGIIPHLTIDDTKMLLDIEGKTELWDGEYDWLVNVANTAAESVGSSGGPALGIVAQTYGRPKNLRGGLVDFKVGGNSIGIRKKGFKLDIQSKDTGTGDHKNRPLCDVVTAKLEIVARQLMGDIETAWYFSQNDAAIEVDLASGYKVKFDAGVLGLADEAVLDEKDPIMKYTLEGDIVYPASFTTTPDSIDIGITDPLTLQFHRVGY